jgi:hypothetical protein
MILGSLTEDENSEFVMPAWIAGIQARKDASGDIHVGLDSSAPCWNDALEGPLLQTGRNWFSDIFKGVFHVLAHTSRG